MATVNKDFKIKHGLIVEGTTATVNGKTVLTEDASDQYILNLIGGETLVKSVSNEFDVSAGGELSIDRTTVDAYYDAAGSADAAEAAAIAAAASDATDKANAAQTAAELTASNALTTAVNDLEAYADQAELDAVSTANSYTNGEITTALSTAQGYADAAESDAVTTANAYTDGRETAITTAYEAYADTAEQDAKNYADAAVAAIVDGAPELLDTLNELAAALQDNPDVISSLQDVAAGKADASDLTDHENATEAHGATGAVVGTTNVQTLSSKTIDNSLGFQDPDTPLNLGFVSANSNVLTVGTMETDIVIAAGSESTSYLGSVLAGNEIATEGYVDDAIANAEVDYSTLAGNNLDWNTEDDQFDVNSADIAAELDTDDIVEGSTNLYFTDVRAKTSAAQLLTGATLDNITITGDENGLVITAENGVADSDTDDLTEGTTNLYFTGQRAIDAVNGSVPNFNEIEIASISRQIALSQVATTAGVQVMGVFDVTQYRSAEFLVKVAYGTHTEISKVLLTLDTSDNIAITEYGIVGTNGSASTISAGVSGGFVQLQITTANNNSTITVFGTLLV